MAKKSECPICSEFKNLKRYHTCMHGTCEDCFHKMVAHIPKGQPITCALCREQHTITELDPRLIEEICQGPVVICRVGSLQGKVVFVQFTKGNKTLKQVFEYTGHM